MNNLLLVLNFHSYLNEIQQKYKNSFKEYISSYDDLNYIRIIFENCGDFIRICRIDDFKSVYGFIEKSTLDLYNVKNYNKPLAKRGSILDPNSWNCCKVFLIS